MSRTTTSKADFIEAKAAGTKPNIAPEVEEELEELDTAERQEEIIKPTSVEIELIGGEKIEKILLPLELSVDQVFRNKILNNLKYFYFLLQSELRHIRSGEIDANDPLAVGILFAPKIQEAMFDLLSTVLKKPATHFQDRLNDEATVQVFQWLITIITNINKGADTKKK